MIKVDKNKCEMQGTVPMLLSEISMACSSLKEIMVEDGMSETEAKESIEHAVKLAFVSEEEIDAEMKKALLGLIMKGLGV